MGEQKVVAINFCSTNKGIKQNGHEESTIMRPMAMYLLGNLWKKGVNAISTFAIAKKQLAENWPSYARRKDLERFARQNRLDYIVSLHMNSEPTGEASGLTTCSNTNHVGQLQTAISKEAHKSNFNIFGNRVKVNEAPSNLGVLEEKILQLSELQGMNDVAAGYINQAMNSYKTSNSNTGLFCTIEASLDPFLTGGFISRKGMVSLLEKIEPLAAEFERGGLLFVHVSPASANDKYVPATLINVGYITNANDLELISKYPKMFAECIGAGIYAAVKSTELVPA